MSCITYAYRLSTPLNSRKQCKHSLLDWNNFVVEKYTGARDAFLEWVATSKPRQGLSFILMSKTRAAFKVTLRYFRQQEDMLRADSYIFIFIMYAIVHTWSKPEGLEGRLSS